MEKVLGSNFFLEASKKNYWPLKIFYWPLVGNVLGRFFQSCPSNGKHYQASPKRKMPRHDK